MLEKNVEKAVCVYSKMYNYLTYKFTSPSNRSVPDRMFITEEGVIFFVEFKAPGKKPTVLQEHTIEKFKQRGVDVYVIDNIPDGKRLIDSYAGKAP